MNLKIVGTIVISVISTLSHAATTNTSRGKIEFTEGHLSPSCRTVSFKYNDTGASKRFRIPSDEGTDINSVILTAMAAKNDVQIWYDDSITTGCGSEPRINYIRIYSN